MVISSVPTKPITRFGVVDCLVSESMTQVTSSDFLCDLDQSYHDRPQITQGPTNRRALSGYAAKSTPTGKTLQQFLQAYKIMPNDNTPLSLTPAEVMVARKIRSVFNKLLPKQTKPG